MQILCYAQEFESAIREENVMYHMLKQKIFGRMLLEMRLGKRVLDLVIDLILLNKSHFTFPGTYRVTRTRNRAHVNKASCLPRRSD